MFNEYIKNSYEVESDFVSGTSLQGYTDAISFYDLVELFGKPTEDTAFIDEKVNVSWSITGKRYYIDEYGDEDWDYVKATVYNWKTSGVPLGKYDWHIGGTGWDSVEFIETIIKEKLKPEHNLTCVE